MLKAVPHKTIEKSTFWIELFNVGGDEKLRLVQGSKFQTLQHANPTKNICRTVAVQCGL